MQNEAMRVLPVVLLLLKAPTLCLQPQRMSFFFFPPQLMGGAATLHPSLSSACPHQVLGCLEGAAAQMWLSSIPPAASLPAALGRERHGPQQGHEI